MQEEQPQEEKQDDNEGSSGHHHHHVSRATYPLPEPLVQRLKAGILRPETALVDNVDNDFSQALTHLVSNSVEAMDNMYFSTPARLRQHTAFQHRLCLRIHASPDSQTLSVTDLGCGMTRADLINSLGIGRAGLLSNNTHHKSSTSSSCSSSSSSQGTATEESTDEEEFEEEEEDDDDDDDMQDNDDNDSEEEQQEDAATTRDGQHSKVLSCRAADLGGFYAALCALGTGVRVQTKSKFDDYYEFEVGHILSSSDDVQDDETAYERFCITRPFEEGTELSVETGFDKFQDVRGDSGTCVTIRLNQRAIDAGLLDEQLLKAMFLKIVETTQYTVAFSSDKETAQDIIAASAKEKEAITELLKEPSLEEQDPLDGVVADMDLGSSSSMVTVQKNVVDEEAAVASAGSHNSVKERAKYIPLRLSLGERKMLRLVEACMNCCEYTTQVDRPFKSAPRRTHEQLKGITSVLRGLVTACDYEAGQQLLLQDGDNNYFAEYQAFFRQEFEIARRHKIMNPEKMRTEYGKLVYLLQDAVSPSIKPHLGFSVKGPIESVYKFLQERNGLGLLSDKLIETATQEILAGKKSRARIDQEIRQKERAVNALKRKYRSAQLSTEDIHLCLYSICDNNSFLNSNRVPIDKIIDYLTSHFAPDKAEEGYSLSIVSGEDGARLSHSHERQYYFALQSLTLWRDIIDDMFRLWAMAEEDLLSESVTYSLQDTGQGMQRVQQSPRTYQAIQQILVRCQKKVSHWVGSSVIHMGDHNVPNALSFIDKYTQVPRILGPIVACLENLERIYEKDNDDGIQHMIDRFGGLEKLRKDILFDFFRSAFDGSGADNFYDAGSCIDGRLTSAWNWCSQLPNKPFYPIFKLTGFIGFDGEFK